MTEILLTGTLSLNHSVTKIKTVTWSTDEYFSYIASFAYFKSLQNDLGIPPPPKKNKLFVAFPWVVTSAGLGGFMICVFII